MDSSGNAYVTGGTTSTNFPGASSSPIQSSLAGLDDAFVAKINAAGSALVYSTYLGGSRGNVDLGIAVDSSGNAYVTGRTDSTDFLGASSSPIQSSFGGGIDAFVAKIGECRTPPAITGVSANPAALWPPNHKLVNVTINYNATAPCGGTPACALSVTSNEPVDGTPDWIVIDAHHVQLRAERLGNGSGRIYTITINCKDTLGNSSSKTTTVSVPHDQGK